MALLVRFALLVTLLSGCRAACMFQSATEPTTAECQTLYAAPTLYFKLRPYATTVDAWSSSYRWDSTGIFDLYDWAADEYKCCNGHINNRHWSVFCDNGVHAHPLPSSPEPCTANGNMPQQRQTPYQGTGTAYYMFHTTAYAPLSSHDADGNYLFYFR